MANQNVQQQSNLELEEAQAKRNENLQQLLAYRTVHLHEIHDMRAETLSVALDLGLRFARLVQAGELDCFHPMQLTENDYRLFADTALFVAAKYEEEEPPKIESFATHTMPHTRADILRMEQAILRAVGYVVRGANLRNRPAAQASSDGHEVPDLLYGATVAICRLPSPLAAPLLQVIAKHHVQHLVDHPKMLEQPELLQRLLLSVLDSPQEQHGEDGEIKIESPQEQHGEDGEIKIKIESPQGRQGEDGEIQTESPQEREDGETPPPLKRPRRLQGKGKHPGSAIAPRIPICDACTKSESVKCNANAAADRPDCTMCTGKIQHGRKFRRCATCRVVRCPACYLTIFNKD